MAAISLSFFLSRVTSKTSSVTRKSDLYSADLCLQMALSPTGNVGGGGNVGALQNGRFYIWGSRLTPSNRDSSIYYWSLTLEFRSNTADANDTHAWGAVELQGD